MTDLETVLPTGVQVLSIDPVVAQDGHVIIGCASPASGTTRSNWCGTSKSRSILRRPAGVGVRWRRPRALPGAQNVSTNNQVNFDILATIGRCCSSRAKTENRKRPRRRSPSEARAQKKPSSATGGNKTP